MNFGQMIYNLIRKKLGKIGINSSARNYNFIYGIAKFNHEGVLPCLLLSDMPTGFEVSFPATIGSLFRGFSLFFALQKG